MPQSRKKIFWLLQSNQTTPVILEFLILLQTRMERLLDLSFIVPDTSGEILGTLKALKPKQFKVKSRSALKNYQAYQAKKMVLGNNTFSNGLKISDALLLDDLGGGNVIQTLAQIPKDDNLAGLILQIPTPLGSSEMEERVFHAAVNWCAQQQVPSLGYELLPLDTRWTLAPGLPDGVIARTRESFEHLSECLGHPNIWRLPLYEASIFTSVSTPFNINGTKAAYHNRSTHKIPEHRTIVFLPHNVAMIYEFQELIRMMTPFGKEIHLMIGYGKDQVRGTYTQPEMVELIYQKELAQFAAHSFHDINAPWEMMLADCLCACSACFQSDIAQEKGVPCLIYDPMLPGAVNGFKHRVNTREAFQEALKTVIERNAQKTEFGTIFMQIAGGKPSHG